MLVMRQQHADLETAREFYATMAETLQPGFVSTVVGGLEGRSSLVSDLMARDLEGPGLSELLSLFFGYRRQRGKLLAAVNGGRLSELLVILRTDPVAGLEALEREDEEGRWRLFELGTEVLHALEPARFPLWTRWVFDEEAETGALLLIIDEETDLFGDNRIDTYGRIQRLNGYLLQTLGAAGMPVDSLQPFSLDVFLAGVYGVYTQTVLQMRMSKEFNKLLPGLGEFIQRLLGTSIGGMKGAGSR